MLSCESASQLFAESYWKKKNKQNFVEWLEALFKKYGIGSDFHEHLF